MTDTVHMDILCFLNSRDVKEHLKNINYQFSPLEAAWIVWQCKSATLVEKYNAWNEIIDTMPDCEVPKRINCRGWDSLHEFLREYMGVTDKYLKLFYKHTEGTIYRAYARYLAKSATEHSPYKFEGLFERESPVFPNLEALTARIREYDCENIDMLRIEKQWLDCDKKIIVDMMPDETVVDVDSYIFDNEDDNDILIEGFAGMYFLIPVPFKKGDILCRYYCNNGYSTDGRGNLCVYEDCILDLEGKFRDSYCKDYTDMTLFGIFQGEDGNLYPECAGCYLDYEYYKGEFVGVKRILKAISR